MRLLFFHCRHGHLFRNRSCPYDGWTHPGVAEAESMWDTNPSMTIDDFRESGIDPELVQRIALVEMDDSWCRCEGLALKSCVIDNSVVPIAEMGETPALKRNPDT